MIVDSKLFREATGLNAHDVFLCPPALPPKHLPKNETNLPANIVDVKSEIKKEIIELLNRL